MTTIAATAPPPPQATGPRVVLVTGKGGVGKSTTAAALAVDSARSGQRTLLMSTDAAHSVGDVLATPVVTSAHFADTVVVDGLLEAQAVGARTEVGADWGVIQGWLLTILAGLDVDPVVADELTALPGAEDIAALLALAAHVEQGHYDVIVVDCAPTAETLRLLALPELLAWHLERLLPAQRRLLTVLRPAAVQAAGVAPPSAEVLAVIQEWRTRMTSVRDILTSPQTSVRIVLTPERMVLAEARRLHTSLALHGYAVDGIVVNRIFPNDGDAWRAAWSQAQHDGMQHVLASFPDLPVTAVPYAAAEPIGMAALASLWADRTLVAGAHHDLLEPVPHHNLRVHADGDDFVLRLAVPHTRSPDVGVVRRDDDLVVSVGMDRRVLALPSVLRRCTVQTASVGHGELKVRFVRNAQEWPRG